jgi:predicted MarR family transcription regulator
MQTSGLTSLSRIHVLQVHKVQHKPRKKLVRGHNSSGANELECV